MQFLSVSLWYLFKVSSRLFGAIEGRSFIVLFIWCFDVIWRSGQICQLLHEPQLSKQIFVKFLSIQFLHFKVMAAIPSFRKNLWPRHCLPSARELVCSIVVSSTTPLSTKDIYNLALKQTAIQLVTDESPEHNVPKKEHPTIVRGIKRQPSTRPPHPEHPVRSLQ
jgi:hypothetical protein